MLVRVSVLFFLLNFSFSKSNAQKKLLSQPSIDVLIEGVREGKDGNIGKTEELFTSISINDTNYVIAQQELAIVYMNTERYELANEILYDLLRYETAYKNRSYVYVLLAQSHNGTEQYDKSHEILNQGIAEYPMSHKLHHLKGATYEQQKDLPNAVKSYEKALQINMNYHDSHLRMGLIAASEGRLTEALFSFLGCLMIEPKGERSKDIVTFMEEIADGSYAPSSNAVLSENGDKFDHVNQLISNKVALQSKYKAKFTISTAYARQLHLILSTLDYNENDEGIWHQLYLDFYKDVYEAGMLDAMILFTLQSVENEKTAKKVASKKTDIDKFVKNAKNLWALNNLSQKMDFEGEKQTVTVVNQSSVVIIGKLKNEKMVGKWYYHHPEGNINIEVEFDDEGKRNGVSRTYDFFTGKLVEETEYKDNVQSGKQRYFYPSGELKQVLTYENDNIIDTVYNYYRGGQLEEKIEIKNGKRGGMSTSYYESGKLKYETEYEDGNPHGVHKAYHKNGSLDLEMVFQNGEANGKRTIYYPNGQIKSDGILKDGLIEGENKKYYANGNIEEQGQMKAGKYFGENLDYYSNGKLYSRGQYDENGKENGVVEYYDSEERKFIAFTYKKGLIQKIELFDTNGAISKTINKSGKKIKYENYYPTRTLYCEGDIIEDKKDGLWKYYDNYGVLTKTENYTNGVIKDSIVAYHPNGKVYYISHYKDGDRDGLYLEYNIFGNLVQEGRYSNGKAVNDWYEYYPDGSLRNEYAFNKDVRHGFYRNYGVNGKLENYEIYSNGTLVSSVYVDTNEMELQRFGQFNGEVKLRDPLNQYDRFIANYNSGSIDGPVKWYDLENKLTSEGNYVNGGREGKWKWYRDEWMWKDIDYQNGEIHGKITEYFKNGKVANMGSYKYGNSEGETIFYYENGKKEIQAFYMDNLRHGNVTTYGTDGSVQQIRKYDRGVLLSYTYLDKNGKELPWVNVEKGESSFTVYYPSGIKAVEQTRINGKLHGEYKEYYPDGKLMIVKNYYYDANHGLSESFHPNGKKKRVINYQYDERDGVELEYYDNGNMKSSKEYRLGERHGETKLYSENGTLLKTYLYYHDQMVGAK